MILWRNLSFLTWNYKAFNLIPTAAILSKGKTDCGKYSCLDIKSSLLSAFPRWHHCWSIYFTNMSLISTCRNKTCWEIWLFSFHHQQSWLLPLGLPLLLTNITFSSKSAWDWVPLVARPELLSPWPQACSEAVWVLGLSHKTWFGIGAAVHGPCFGHCNRAQGHALQDLHNTLVLTRPTDSINTVYLYCIWAFLTLPVPLPTIFLVAFAVGY